MDYLLVQADKPWYNYYIITREILGSLLAWLFSKKTPRYCHRPGVGGVRRRAKTLTFSNISVITEDIYLKLRIVTIKRGTHTNSGGNPPIFLTKLCPFFDLEFSKCSLISLLLLKIFT